jgi:hypothetical protein
MDVLFAYDGSESADAALATVAAIVDPHNLEAVVLCVWEPLTLQALRAELRIARSSSFRRNRCSRERRLEWPTSHSIRTSARCFATAT